jgi:hypothetical protein
MNRPYVGHLVRGVITPGKDGHASGGMRPDVGRYVRLVDNSREARVRRAVRVNR